MFNNIIFFIISYDIWFYTSHIILHNIYFYKNIHRIHHSINNESINYTMVYSMNILLKDLFKELDFYFHYFL